jgi:predicted nucleotidyltransferase
LSVHLNSDFSDFLVSLNASQVDYIVVGGYAVIHYGHSRTTGDIDIWVKKSKENYDKIKLAFRKFGMPVFDMSEENFLENPEMNVFSFGKPPVSIDILTSVLGLEFEETFEHAVSIKWDHVPTKVIDLKNLIKAKISAGRPKDLDDLENIGK